MKTMRRKKSQTMVKDTKPKDYAQGSIEGGGKKTSQVPHMIHIISHLDPMIFNCHHIRKFSG